MLDRRYPNLRHIESAPDHARRAAAAIVRRTGLSAAWDTKANKVYFYRNGDPQRGMFAVPYKGHGPLTDAQIDDAVRLIGSARMPVHLKKRIEVDRELSDRIEAEKLVDKDIEERKRESVKYLQHKRNVRGMHKKYRPSVVVNGLKGA